MGDGSVFTGFQSIGGADKALLDLPRLPEGRGARTGSGEGIDFVVTASGASTGRCRSTHGRRLGAVRRRSRSAEGQTQTISLGCDATGRSRCSSSAPKATEAAGADGDADRERGRRPHDRHRASPARRGVVVALVHAVVLRVRARDAEPVLDRAAAARAGGRLRPRARRRSSSSWSLAPSIASAAVAAAGDALIAVGEREFRTTRRSGSAQLVAAARSSPAASSIRRAVGAGPSDPRLEEHRHRPRPRVRHAGCTRRRSAASSCCSHSSRAARSPTSARAPACSQSQPHGSAGRRCVAVDYDEASVEATRAERRAERRRGRGTARRPDSQRLRRPAGTLVANVPAAGTRRGAGRPRRDAAPVIVSGVTPADGRRGRRRRTPTSVSSSGAVSSSRTGPPCCSPRRRRAPRAGADPVRPAAPPGLRGGAAGRVAINAAGQLETGLPNGGLALSSSHELPTGARVAVLLAPGLFRLDLRHLEDTLKISIRNLGSTPIRSLPADRPPATVQTSDDVTLDYPWRRTPDAPPHRARDANVVLSALSGREPGSGRVTAQAIIGPP